MLYKKLMGSAMTKAAGYKLKEREREEERSTTARPCLQLRKHCVRKEATHAQAASGLRLRMLHAEEAAREVRKERGEGGKLTRKPA